MQDTWRRAVQQGAITLAVCLSLGFSVAAELPEFHRGTWPFCPPERPAVPQVANQAWIRNPIDTFVLARLEAKGLAPNTEAGRRKLLRRVTFDLTGLPPTPQEQAAFLADTADGAYERVVDRLLASPRYGERWAQHWLDVVRYAETDGFNADGLRPNAYKYRDYVIRAFNADLSYDRFIRQQLAGDELEPGDLDASVATGLNRLYPDEYNAANLRLRRQEIHDNLTDTTGLVFLGLTIGCAQCHDHKFDPITQADYFRLQAFFATMVPRDDVPIVSPDEAAQYATRRAEWEAATADIRREMDELLARKRENAFRGAVGKFDQEIQTAIRAPASERSCLQQQIAFQAMLYVSTHLDRVNGDSLQDESKQRFQELEAKLAEFASLKPADLPTAMIVTDAEGEAPPTFRLAQGDYRKPLEQVQPGFPAFLGASEPLLETPPVGAQSSGRRAALARWLCRPDHPLTSRVIVNRVWKHHFGVGIVATPNDFGAMGEPPTHPELLDWLAVEFMDQGWSLKTLHRLMVTSATYRQSSRVDLATPTQAHALQSDGANRLLWHAHRRRLEGEAVRDAVLQVSGDLAAERMFGPSAQPELPPGLTGKQAWKVNPQPHEQHRRSVYIFAKRNLRFPLLEIFDLPDLQNSCPERSVTTTAPQALALLNGEFALLQAQRWSERLIAEYGEDTAAIVRAAWTAAFARDASQSEVTLACEFIARQTGVIEPGSESAGAARTAAVADFCHAIFNANEFLYID